MINSAFELEPISMEADDHGVAFDITTDTNYKIASYLFTDILGLYTKYPRMHISQKFKVTNTKCNGFLSILTIATGKVLLDCTDLFSIRFWLRKKTLGKLDQFNWEVCADIVGDSPYNKHEADIILHKLFQEHIIPHLDKSFTDPSWYTLKNPSMSKLHLFSEKIDMSKELRTYWKRPSGGVCFDNNYYRMQYSSLRKFITDNNITMRGTIKLSP